jgi:hypothetical protein
MPWMKIPWGTFGGWLIASCIGWLTVHGLLSSEGKLGKPGYEGEYVFGVLGLGVFGMIVGTLFDEKGPDAEQSSMVKIPMGIVGTLAGVAIGLGISSMFGMQRQSFATSFTVGTSVTLGAALFMHAFDLLRQQKRCGLQALLGILLIALFGMGQIMSSATGSGFGPWSWLLIVVGGVFVLMALLGQRQRSGSE